MLNHIVIMGRLTRDPELRTTQSGVSVTSFTVAVDRDFGGRDGGEKQTDFIDCVAWRQTGEFISKYFTKGRMAVVSGRLQSRKWETKEGDKRTSWEVVVDNAYFGDSRRDSDSSRSDNYGSNYGNSYSNAGNSYSSNAQSSYGGYDSGRSGGRIQLWLSIRTIPRTASAEKFASSALIRPPLSTIRTLPSFAASCPSAARSCRAVPPVFAPCISVSSPRRSREPVRSLSCPT